MFSEDLAKKLAIKVPEIECQAQDMAQGRTERGLAAAKKAEERLVARPAFCIPTSMLSVRFLGVEKELRVATR